MNELQLKGCTPEPLMGYLKALGVFRLVSDQADPAARGWWAEGVFVLRSKLDREGLQRFLLDNYRPTPVLAPWNGGSGFYAGGSDPLTAIAASSAPRLRVYRETIAAIRSLVPIAKPKDEEKEHLLTRCRAELADEVVAWLDTCYVLGEDGPGYFPLLGTGGNDGRLDFTNNFMQRLADVIALDEAAKVPKQSEGWLSSALFADTLCTLDKAAIGQFNPGGIGGANGVQGRFEADSRVNPWDFVLMLEGVMFFAGSVARRLWANGQSRASFPFTVQSVAVGYGSATASEETTDGSRAEMWLPLWEKPTSYGATTHLFAEGRAQFGRRQARNAVEFAVAACLLGVGRGIESFARYGFLKRNGLAFIAAPLGRVSVRQRPLARLLEDPELTSWLERLRSACRDKDRAPARYQAVLRDIDRTMFEFANRSQLDETADPTALIEVLAALGRAERTLSLGLRFCEDKNIRPLQRLNLDWLKLADTPDEFRAFRLAASLASILAPGRKSPVGPLRVHLEPVEVKGRSEWDAGSTSAVWSNRPLADNLAAVFLRRLMETERADGEGVALTARLPAQLGDVVAFLEGETDDELLADLLWAMVGLNWTGGKLSDEVRKQFRVRVPRVPRDFALLRLIAEPVALQANNDSWSAATKSPTHTSVPLGMPFQLLGRSSSHDPHSLDKAVDLAAHRLWSDGLTPFGWANRRQRQHDYPSGPPADPVRLLAACLFPLSRTSLARLANRALARPVPTT